MASMAFGEQRFTNDIDVLLALEPKHVEAFCDEFPGPEYYLRRAAVESAIRKQFQFNIIHPTSGLKIDCIISGTDAHLRSELARAIVINRDGGSYAVRFASPEDVIIKKLEYFQLGESEKHIRDICGILKVQGDRIDRPYILDWVKRKNIEEIWQAVLERLEARL